MKRLLIISISMLMLFYLSACSHELKSPQPDMLLLIKAASATANVGSHGYDIGMPKDELVERLTNAWNDGSDPVAVELKQSARSNQYFDDDIVEALMRVLYTYSYYEFADRYALKPNRGYDDAKDITFVSYSVENEFDGYFEAEAQRYLDYSECKFYEYDFNGDGETEIGVPIHTGAGGASGGDGFGIFKQNQGGLYEIYAHGPSCTLMDGMRIIQYEGKIYFITNPVSDRSEIQHNIGAYYIDENRNSHSVFIKCNDYVLKTVTQKTEVPYSSIEKQAHEAIAHTKKGELYSPEWEGVIPFQSNIKWDGIYGLEADPKDIAFYADIDNDGTDEIVRKVYFITQTKYFDEYNCFQVYENLSELEQEGDCVSDYSYRDEYIGLHSYGNIYDVLPVNTKLSQFWTYEFKDETYLLTLTRNKTLYTLNVYKQLNNEVLPVSEIMFLDEFQKMDIEFGE